MSRRRLFSRSREPGEEDFELNLASIIDCFTVVITYLLFTASFISLAELDVSAVTVGGSATSPAPAVSISVGLEHDKILKVLVRGSQNLSLDVPSRDGNWDFAGLDVKLGELKRKWPAVDSVAVGAGDDVQYQEIVKAVEETRKTFPKVGLTDLATAGES